MNEVIQHLVAMIDESKLKHDELGVLVIKEIRRLALEAKHDYALVITHAPKTKASNEDADIFQCTCGAYRCRCGTSLWLPSREWISPESEWLDWIFKIPFATFQTEDLLQIDKRFPNG